MKAITTHITQQLVEQLDKMSKETGMPKAEIIRRALTEYFAKK